MGTIDSGYITPMTEQLYLSYTNSIIELVHNLNYMPSDFNENTMYTYENILESNNNYKINDYYYIKSKGTVKFYPFIKKDNNEIIKPFIYNNQDDYSGDYTLYLGGYGYASYSGTKINGDFYVDSNNDKYIAVGFTLTGTRDMYPLYNVAPYRKISSSGSSIQNLQGVVYLENKHAFYKSGWIDFGLGETYQVSALEYYTVGTQEITTIDSNIPIFTPSMKEELKEWIKSGVRPTDIKTGTNFKLWIKGLDAPTYKLNWHNEYLENKNFDFSDCTIYIRCGKTVSDGTYAFNMKEIPYNDSSVKFTWYDVDEFAETNLIFAWATMEIYAIYIDESGEEHKSIFCSVNLRKKSNNFSGMYQNVTNGNDGSTLTIVNYEDDPSGFDDDEDDYHDPSDNEDDTPDDSTDVSVSGEVCKTFKIDQIELKKLSQFLWSSGFFDNILLVNNSPIENIISLKALIGTVATTGSSQALALGNVTTTANVVPCNESITINVGSITLPRKYNNFLDFEPYTKVQIYLPFYGCAMLDSSLVIGRTITIKYIIDVITATAKIKIIHDNKTLYEFKTTCGCDLPITSSNRASVEMGYLSSGVGMGISIASGNVLGGLASGLSMAQSQYHSSTSGNVSGVLNFHDSRMITVLVDRPVYTELRNFNKTHGRVCNLSKTLRDLRGFTKCAENVQIPFNCLDEERTMIIEQLTNGVII